MNYPSDVFEVDKYVIELGKVMGKRGIKGTIKVAGKEPEDLKTEDIKKLIENYFYGFMLTTKTKKRKEILNIQYFTTIFHSNTIFSRSIVPGFPANHFLVN